MTEKEAMLFAYQQSAEPMIKNKVLRDALDKDLGPRNTYAQGQLVSNTVDGSRPGYAGDETFLVKIGNPKNLNPILFF